MSWITKQLNKRNKIIKKHSGAEPNYFKWEDYLELDKYSTYIFITPRGLGKTHSGHQLIIDVYKETGEWTNWVRTRETETKEILKDYKSNRPEAWPEWATLRGSQLIDSRDGSLICKFVSLSTIGNLASITGNNCFGIFYDEFLPRQGYPVSKAHTKMTDYIRTIERKHLATVILSANMTTLNSDILEKFDLWIDEPVVDDTERRLRFRYISTWENPPKVEMVSSAAMWAKCDENLRKFMDEGGVLDDSTSLVLPLSRIHGGLRYLYMYMIEGITFTLALDDTDRYVCIEGELMGGSVYDLTTEDGYIPTNNHVRPYDLNLSIQPIKYGLEQNNLIFTSFEVKEKVFSLLRGLLGKLTRKGV